MSLRSGWARLVACWVPPAEVRAEVWAMGVRHGGRVVEGAREESLASGLTFRRAILLKAVIREGRLDLRDKGRRLRS
jgi:hypothetical protein